MLFAPLSLSLYALLETFHQSGSYFPNYKIKPHGRELVLCTYFYIFLHTQDYVLGRDLTTMFFDSLFAFLHIINIDMYSILVMYGYKSWTIRGAEHQRIDAFELWCWKRLLSVP